MKTARAIGSGAQVSGSHSSEEQYSFTRVRMVIADRLERGTMKWSIWTWSVSKVAAGLGFLIWVCGTELKRRVAPGARHENRHEFENVESRTGSFGRVL